MILKLQKIREGTSHESYRIALPKAIIDVNGWKDKNFKIEIKGNKIILTPTNSKE